MKKVLFVCVHNSARIQLAEALLNRMCGGEFQAESAGLKPGMLARIKELWSVLSCSCIAF
jgi:arsenate reductase (thioredoxin)